jgi:TP901-1 family phage major tail protein
MALQKGRDMLIYRGNVLNAANLIGGLIETGLTLNGNVVDGSTKDTVGWRELVEDANLRSFSISCSGMFKDSTSDDLMRQAAFNQTIERYTLKFPNGHKIECDFQVTNYVRTGGVDGVETYSFTLESSGVPVYLTA